jgi:trehalose 6-phosphate synthase/phosphatase
LEVKVMPTTGRLLIVSNRLPVSATVGDGALRLSNADGGLATGLRPWHQSSNGLWIGWPGDAAHFSPTQRAQLDDELQRTGLVPVHLSSDHIDRYYHGFANRVLWPLFHYLIDRVPLNAAGWDAYRAANEAFAAVVVREFRPGDVIWVHDYQLMLLPALLRQRLPNAQIGFFLHIPFPASEVFRVLPWRREILQGVLGADLLGFHTRAYVRYFANALERILGIVAEGDYVSADGRAIRLGSYPMGIDAARFAELAHDPAVRADAAKIRSDAGARQIVLGVDRLDYTKGIPRRLEAIEYLLAQEPDFADSMRFIQVAVPSRGEVDSYQKFKRLVEETVGRINGARSTIRSTPVHYVHRSVSEKQLVALYCAADVMLVTPLRDGMNLVAKEYVAARVNDDGVLVLSEFAGAAVELDSALIVNPYDIEAVAATIKRALTLPPDERRARMTRLRRRVHEYDVHAWAQEFVEHLWRAHGSVDAPGAVDTSVMAS